MGYRWLKYAYCALGSGNLLPTGAAEYAEVDVRPDLRRRERCGHQDTPGDAGRPGSLNMGGGPGSLEAGNYLAALLPAFAAVAARPL